MTNVFTSLSVQPSYGNLKTAVSWNVLPQYKSGTIFVYKSYTGAAPWELVHEDGVPANIGYYEDDVAGIVDRVAQDIWYRLLLEVPQSNGEVKEFDSPIISLFHKLDRREHFIVRHIMRQELEDMKKGNGIKVLMYAPLMQGKPSVLFDSQTRQMIIANGTEPDGTDSYGMPFIGGFAEPVETYIKFTKIGTIAMDRPEDGNGRDELQPIQARMLAFPKPDHDYLLIEPTTDRRYIISDTINGHLFKGIAPVIYDVTLQAIPRRDAKYRVPIPAKYLNN
jgi:hypothetical protein